MTRHARAARHRIVVALALVASPVACGSSGAASIDYAATRSDASKENDQAPDASASIDEGIVEAPDDGASDVPLPDGSSPGRVILDHARIGSRNGTGWPNVGTASAAIDFDGPFEKATLIVDLDTTCFPFEKWTENPPPAGQNWPADCDAFDRNFNVFIDDRASSDAGGPPSFEVVHAITPFGGPEHIEVDVTDLANGLPGQHRITADINAYSDPTGQVTGSNNGWTVTVKLDAHRGTAPRHVLGAVSLFNGTQNPGDTAPVVSFMVPAATTGGRIEYRTSGHGQGNPGIGCIGPAEEFCNHPHRILIDGAPYQETLRTWRTDCGRLCTIAHGTRFDSYCAENPCGDPASVVASRANWCPGSMTPPFVWEDIPALSTPGSHTIRFDITPILSGGTWLVSAIYYAYGLI